MAAGKAKDPTVTSGKVEATEGAHPAPPIHEAADYAGDREYVDAPDKPAPEAVAQHEVVPGDKG